MAHRWVTDVLEDLRSFAEANALVALAVKLEETITIARAELDARQDTLAARPVMRDPRNIN